DATVSIRPVISPMLVSLERFGFHHQPTALALRFNVPLDPARAQDVGNYELVRLDARGRPSRQIPIASAAFDPATDTVVLHPARRLYLFVRHKLTINGSFPDGLTNTFGIYLGATRPGAPGLSPFRVFGAEILAGPYSARPGAPGRASHRAQASHRPRS